MHESFHSYQQYSITCEATGKSQLNDQMEILEFLSSSERPYIKVSYGLSTVARNYKCKE